MHIEGETVTKMMDLRNMPLEKLIDLRNRIKQEARRRMAEAAKIAKGSKQKRRGRVRGQPPRVTKAVLEQLAAQGLTYSEAARVLNYSTGSFYSRAKHHGVQFAKGTPKRRKVKTKS